jgi:hypothetical protein
MPGKDIDKQAFLDDQLGPDEAAHGAAIGERRLRSTA